MSWQPLAPATRVKKSEAEMETLLAKARSFKPGITREQFEAQLDEAKLWMNDKYQVAVYDAGPFGDESGCTMKHLSIKRLDKAPCRDWRDFQRIKNQLCGPESEAVELYPAESRVVDTANQYHLWVFVGARLPFGFPVGMKWGADEAHVVGAKQRDGA